MATTSALATFPAQKPGRLFQLESPIRAKGLTETTPGRPRMGDLGQQTMEKFAKELGLNMERFLADMKSTECQADIRGDQQVFARIGVRSTPAFFVNGRYIRGAQPLAVFQAIIDEEKKKAETVLSAGANRDVGITKFNNAGDFVWESIQGGVLADGTTDVLDVGSQPVVDANGSVFVLIASEGGAIGSTTNQGGDDVFIVKLDGDTGEMIHP